MIKDITKGTDERFDEEIHTEGMQAQGLLFPRIWGIPPSWRVDMFNLEAL